ANTQDSNDYHRETALLSHPVVATIQTPMQSARLKTRANAGISRWNLETYIRTNRHVFLGDGKLLRRSRLFLCNRPRHDIHHGLWPHLEALWNVSHLERRNPAPRTLASRQRLSFHPGTGISPHRSDGNRHQKT